MKGVAAGDLASRIRYAGDPTELGRMADTLTEFRDALSAAEDMRKVQEEAKAAESAAIARRAVLAEGFVTRMSELAGGFASSSGEVQQAAQTLSVAVCARSLDRRMRSRRLR